MARAVNLWLSVSNVKSGVNGEWKQAGAKYKKSRGASIEGGDSGVFVTCDMGKETRCIAEALDLFSQVRLVWRFSSLAAQSLLQDG